jgi:hypothetical protein
MALSVLSAPATDLLSTPERLKADLGITDDASDEALFRTLERASSAVTRECGRPSFGVGQYQETTDGSGSQLLGLSCVPLLAVVSVLEDTAPLATLALDPEDGYAIEDPEAPTLYRPSGWSRTWGGLRWGQESYASRYILPGGSGTLRYTVTYWAGYVLPEQTDDPQATPIPTLPVGASAPPALPGALEQATLVTARAWWHARARDPSLAALKIGARQDTYAPGEGALPAAALALLRDYRRVA